MEKEKKKKKKPTFKMSQEDLDFRASIMPALLSGEVTATQIAKDYPKHNAKKVQAWLSRERANIAKQNASDISEQIPTSVLANVGSVSIVPTQGQNIHTPTHSTTQSELGRLAREMADERAYELLVATKGQTRELLKEIKLGCDIQEKFEAILANCNDSAQLRNITMAYKTLIETKRKAGLQPYDNIGIEKHSPTSQQHLHLHSHGNKNSNPRS